jgi:hypothetical protein
MNTKIMLITAAMLPLLAMPAAAQESTVSGAAGGAVTGAVVGGPVGAAIGGVVGAIAGTAIDPPPREVVTYVREQPLPATPVVVEREIIVGEPVPETVLLTAVPEAPQYSYAVVNKQRVIVDPQTRVVVEVVN